MIHPGRPNVSKNDLREKLAEMYKVKEVDRVFVFGFRTQYGGGSSTGFALIYDSIEEAKKFEPRYRLARVSDRALLLTSTVLVHIVSTWCPLCHWAFSLYLVSNILYVFVLCISQSGLTKGREGSRKQIKEKKNRGKKVFGCGRRIARHKAKKAGSS